MDNNFPFLFLSSQQRSGSKETRGGRENKEEEELERKRAGEENKKREETGRDRQDGEGEGAKPGDGGEEKKSREKACCAF